MSDGLLCRCSVCDREVRAGAASPLRNGWPKCCGYTMTLIDTQRFIETVDAEMDVAIHGQVRESPERIGE